MQVVTDLGQLTRAEPTILTIGTFDGVHRGHQWLIRQVADRARARGHKSLVITFDPSPAVTLRPGGTQLTEGTEKIRLISSVGPDVTAMLHFDHEMANVTAGQFLAEILDHVNLEEIWVGGDFAFGHNREGTVEYLIRAGQRTGFSVMVVPRRAILDVPVSSTMVRELMRKGDVARAAELLGHYPSIRGTVVTGARRGRQMGYPTANVAYPESQVLPATGIYAGYLRTDGGRLPAAISVGFNLVFAGREIKAEAYILDFDEDVLDTVVSLDFVERLRDEQNFESVDALVQQMGRDVEQTREILARAEEPGELLL
ncbi:MAG TPA: bifunctional riboflavin kinase/FAD synthetase [Chloroflexota bacterium]